MVRRITARHDPMLKARIVRHTPLYYDDDLAGNMERPPYVRAGSSLTRIAEYVAVVQDDANFIALIDVNRSRATSLPLPADRDGDRVFDEAHGNTRQKFDLEACLTIPGEDGPLLVAFGSGSKPERERIITVRWRDRARPEVSMYQTTAFYAMLRKTHDFAGSELNVEGAVYLGDDRVRLFQRGNGAPRDGLQPVDATCDLVWSALWVHLQQPNRSPPVPENIVQYQLGSFHGHRLNFSDAEAVENVILYSASAEASSASGKGGSIQGSVLGVIDAVGARYASVMTEEGDEFDEKIEGLIVGLGDPSHAYFVVDDDKDQPSALFEVELSGPWFPTGN